MHPTIEAYTRSFWACNRSFGASAYLGRRPPACTASWHETQRTSLLRHDPASSGEMRKFLRSLDRNEVRPNPSGRAHGFRFVAIPALLIRLPLTPDCRTMSEARAAGKAGPPAQGLRLLLLATISDSAARTAGPVHKQAHHERASNVAEAGDRVARKAIAPTIAADNFADEIITPRGSRGLFSRPHRGRFVRRPGRCGAIRGQPAGFVSRSPRCRAANRTAWRLRVPARRSSAIAPSSSASARPLSVRS